MRARFFRGRVSLAIGLTALAVGLAGCGDDDDSSGDECPVESSVCQFAIRTRDELTKQDIQSTAARADETRVDCKALPGVNCPADGHVVGVPVGKYGGQASVLSSSQLAEYLTTAFLSNVRLVSIGCESDDSCAQAFALAFASGQDAATNVAILRYAQSDGKPRLVAAYTWRNGGAVVDGGDEEVGEVFTGRKSKLTFHRYSPE